MLFIITNTSNKRKNRSLSDIYPCLKRYQHFNYSGVEGIDGYSIDRKDYINIRSLEELESLQDDLNESNFEPHVFKKLLLDFENHNIVIIDRKEISNEMENI